MRPLRIGTRGSALAIVQAESVRDALLDLGTAAEVVPMRTSGDEGVPADLDPRGLKGLWIDTILDALEAGDIDIAVHSAKDLPAEDDDGFVIGAVPSRADPSDVLITREGGLPAGGVIGTSSLRRRAQLLAASAGLSVIDLRGNVDTRLRKLAEGVVDATVLAAAGLARLGIEPEHARILSVQEMVPAPGQGSLAVQCRDGDDAILAALSPLDDHASHRALEAERSLMWRLGGGCALPLGAYALVDAQDSVELSALIASPNGARVLRAAARGGDPEEVAAEVARSLISQGAESILVDARADGDET